MLKYSMTKILAYSFLNLQKGITASDFVLGHYHYGTQSISSFKNQNKHFIIQGSLWFLEIHYLRHTLSSIKTNHMLEFPRIKSVLQEIKTLMGFYRSENLYTGFNFQQGWKVFTVGKLVVNTFTFLVLFLYVGKYE